MAAPVFNDDFTHAVVTLRLASIPDGWRKVGGLFYCPAHKIKIVVDGIEADPQ
jgi:hypothetical protein